MYGQNHELARAREQEPSPARHAVAGGSESFEAHVGATDRWTLSPPAPLASSSPTHATSRSALGAPRLVSFVCPSIRLGWTTR